MGGEPTFVSVDDPDGAEWNTAALGPDKRRLAVELFSRLKQKYAPQGLAHFGQGKWYPGEQLPRWSLNCFWRRDGEPIWQNPELLDDETNDYGVNADDRAGVSSRRSRSSWGCRREYVFRGLRRRVLLPVARAPLAGQRRSVRFEARGSAGTRAAGASVRAGSRQRRRPRAAGRTRHVGRTLAHRPLVPAPRALLPDSRRFAARLSLAARFAAVGHEGATIRTCIRRIRRQSPTAAARARRHSPPAARRRRCDARERGGDANAARKAGATESSRRARAPPAQRVGALAHAHGDVRRSRATACSICSCRRPTQLEDYLELVARDRSAPQKRIAAGGARRLRAAERSAPQLASA